MRTEPRQVDGRPWQRHSCALAGVQKVGAAMTLHAPIEALPAPAAQPRISMSEVCAIALVGRLTIQRRVKAGRFPAPIDRGREAIFDRQAAYAALGITQEAGNHAGKETLDPWLAGADALCAR